MIEDRIKMFLTEVGIKAHRLSLDMGYNGRYIQGFYGKTTGSLSDYFYEYVEVRFNVNPEWLREGTGEMFLPGGKTNRTKSAMILRKLNSLPQKESSMILDLLNALEFRAKYAKDHKQNQGCEDPEPNLEAESE